MKDSSVLSNFSFVRSLAAEKVNKEVALNLLEDLLTLYIRVRTLAAEKVNKEVVLNLLEDLLTLYIRVRTFSFVNQKKEKFKLEAKKQKMNSLRESINKFSSTLEMGH